MLVLVSDDQLVISAIEDMMELVELIEITIVTPLIEH